MLKILGGQFKGRPLKSPKNKTTRPSQGVLRQAVFNICQHEIDQARFLDLFAGSGAVGLEALSRGASRVVFVEKDREAIRVLRENISLLHLEEKTDLLTTDILIALRKLASQNAVFDLIYIDPPYSQTHLILKALGAIQEQRLLADDGTLFVEDSAQTPELSYEKQPLAKKDVRKFGIARLYRFKYEKET